MANGFRLQPRLVGGVLAGLDARLQGRQFLNPIESLRYELGAPATRRPALGRLREVLWFVVPGFQPAMTSH